MYLEFLAEDLSGSRMLEILIPRIVPQLTGKEDELYVIHNHRGISKLLKKLPGRLKAFSETYKNDPEAYAFVVCDLDANDKAAFLAKLQTALIGCPNPERIFFCLAIEEMEAWLLGDIAAIKSAYRILNPNTLKKYTNDSICGTWEKLADVIYKGGSAALIKLGHSTIGTEKYKWAENIAPYMNIGENKSPSFRHFRDTLLGAMPAAAGGAG